VTVNSKEENSEDFCPNYVQEFGLRSIECLGVSPPCIMLLYVHKQTCKDPTFMDIRGAISFKNIYLHNNKSEIKTFLKTLAKQKVISAE
jgi:hypothetical protein